ncbi:MAG: hypothetical protein EBR94_09020 [Bacteroidetes bacterium]|nr:hypothetical protein [Bacteroidota bacterium]
MNFLRFRPSKQSYSIQGVNKIRFDAFASNSVKSVVYGRVLRKNAKNNVRNYGKSQVGNCKFYCLKKLYNHFKIKQPNTAIKH